MIKLLTTKNSVLNAQNFLVDKLNGSFQEHFHIKVGYQGGHYLSDVRYSPEHDIWCINRKLSNRFWNGFGVGRPILGEKSNSIAVEINVPFEGVNRRIAGVFAKEDNRLLWLHRGKIGGGKKGVGKKQFLEHFSGESISVDDGLISDNLCFVADLNSELWLSQIASFINSVSFIKQQINNILSIGPSLESGHWGLSPETFGVSGKTGSAATVMNRTHGIIWNELYKYLRAMKYTVSNNRFSDLFIIKNGVVHTLFEIKTNLSTQSIYTAVGQLLIHGSLKRKQHKLVLVIPRKLDVHLENKLSEIGIEIIYYYWAAQTPIFLGLDRAF